MLQSFSSFANQKEHELRACAAGHPLCHSRGELRDAFSRAPGQVIARGPRERQRHRRRCVRPAVQPSQTQPKVTVNDHKHFAMSLDLYPRRQTVL